MTRYLMICACRLVEGKTILDVIQAVQKHLRKHCKNPAKLAALREWLWHFTAHVAHGLAEVSYHSALFGLVGILAVKLCGCTLPAAETGMFKDKSASAALGFTIASQQA